MRENKDQKNSKYGHFNFINVVRKKENRIAPIDEASKTNICNAVTTFTRNLYLVHLKQLHCILHHQTKIYLLYSRNKASAFSYFAFLYPDINTNQTSSVLRNTHDQIWFSHT